MQSYQAILRGYLASVRETPFSTAVAPDYREQTGSLESKYNLLPKGEYIS